MDIVQFGINVERLIKLRGLRNPTHLADECGIPQPTLSRALSKKHQNMQFDTIDKLAKFFNVSIDSLVGNKPLVLDDPTHKDEFKTQLDKFYGELSGEGKHTLVAHANFLWSLEHPARSNGTPFAEGNEKTNEESIPERKGRSM
jgi:transcriptional regulator with XRE-family HTH domain